MKYLKIYEDFEHWEKIPANDWYKTFEWENLPFSKTEYAYLQNICIDNYNYDDYELDYDYINPNERGNYRYLRSEWVSRAWKFTIMRFKKDEVRETGEKRLLEDSTLSIFKKRESESSAPLYFLHYVYKVNAEGGFYECDRFQDLFSLVKKHLGLT